MFLVKGANDNACYLLPLIIPEKYLALTVSNHVKIDTQMIR